MRTWMLLGVLALAGCDKLGGSKEAASAEVPEAERKEPPKGDWEDWTLGQKLVFAGKSEKVEVRLTGNRGKLVLSLNATGFPKGSKLSAAGRKMTAESPSYALLEAPLDDFKVGEVTLADAQDNDARVPVDVSIEVAWPDTKPFTAKVPPLLIRMAADDAIKDIAKAPIAFKGEPAGDGKVDSIALLDINGHIEEVIGAGKTLQDLDIIATSDNVKTDRKKKCTGYEKGDIELVMVDRTVTAYDRRTGNKVQDKTFKADEECPSFAMVRGNTAEAWAKKEEIVAWLKTLMK